MTAITPDTWTVTRSIGPIVQVAGNEFFTVLITRPWWWKVLRWLERKMKDDWPFRTFEEPSYHVTSVHEGDNTTITIAPKELVDLREAAKARADSFAADAEKQWLDS